MKKDPLEFMIRDYYEENCHTMFVTSLKVFIMISAFLLVNEITVKGTTSYVVTLKNKTNDKTFGK